MQICIGFPRDKDNVINRLITSDPLLAKMGVMFSRNHLIPEGFWQRLGQPWQGDTNFSSLAEPLYAYHCMEWALNEKFKHTNHDHNVTKFVNQYWDYIKPGGENIELLFRPQDGKHSTMTL